MNNFLSINSASIESNEKTSDQAIVETSDQEKVVNFDATSPFNMESTKKATEIKVDTSIETPITTTKKDEPRLDLKLEKDLPPLGLERINTLDNDKSSLTLGNKPSLGKKKKKFSWKRLFRLKA